MSSIALNALLVSFRLILQVIAYSVRPASTPSPLAKLSVKTAPLERPQNSLATLWSHCVKIVLLVCTCRRQEQRCASRAPQAGQRQGLGTLIVRNANVGVIRVSLDQQIALPVL